MASTPNNAIKSKQIYFVKEPQRYCKDKLIYYVEKSQRITKTMRKLKRHKRQKDILPKKALAHYKDKQTYDRKKL